MTDTPQVLLAHHLKTLNLPTFLREYDKIARQCASEGVDHVRYLLRLAELELIDRERRMVERRIKAARFPVVKSLDSFDFKVIPSLNKALVLELARCEYIERRENLIALGNSGTGKTHIALGLGLAACQKGLSVGFITAAALVHELIEARDDKQLLRFQKKLATYKLLIVDELGFVPLSKTGAELLFEVFSQRYERGSTLVTTNLPFDEWTEVFGSERLWCMEPRWCDRPFPGWLADPDCVWFRRTDGAIECVDLHGDFGLLGLECASVELAAVEPLDASHGCFAKRSQSVALSFLPVHPSLRRDLRRMVLPFRSAMRRVRGRNGCGAWRDDDFRW